jgi:hypothetical protein
MTKRINTMISINNFQNLLEYKASIEEKYKKARNGKDPNCKKCNEYGVIEGAIEEELNGKMYKFDQKCDCWSDEKDKLEAELQKTIDNIRRYKEIFGVKDNDMSFSKYAKEYNRKIIKVFQAFLKASSSASIFIKGESASGKTTLLKMLWQIYTINNVKVFYLKASYFEKLYKQLYSANAPKNLQESINTKIDNIKKSDIILIDDIASVSFSAAKAGYYEIFENLYKNEKTVVMTSSKSISEIFTELKSKQDKESIKITDRLISRILGLGILRIDTEKANANEKIIISKKENLKEA